MRDALILAGLTIAGVVALFPSSSPAPVDANLVAKAVPARPEAVASAPAPAPPVAIALERADDGHFYAPVTVGTGTVKMLVDTGASVVALTAADARAAGVQWSMGQMTVVAQGASGPVQGVALMIERMNLGPYEGRNVPAVVIPEGLPVSLLGQSFLRNVEPVRIENDRMVLGGG